MAKYEHLPIYKVAMDLAIFTENNIKNMSRYNKYTLGTELRKRAIKILSLVVQANSSPEKIKILEKLRILLEELKQILFLAKETKALPSFHVYKEMMEKLESLARQNEGWIKSQKKSNK